MDYQSRMRGTVLLGPDGESFYLLPIHMPRLIAVLPDEGIDEAMRELLGKEVEVEGMYQIRKGDDEPSLVNPWSIWSIDENAPTLDDLKGILKDAKPKAVGEEDGGWYMSNQR